MTVWLLKEESGEDVSVVAMAPVCFDVPALARKANKDPCQLHSRLVIRVEHVCSLFRTTVIVQKVNKKY